MEARLKESWAYRALFVLAVQLVIAFNYLVFVWLTLYETLGTTWKMIILELVVHFFFFLTMWSYIQTMRTDPGRVPMYWGFLLNDSNEKRMKYCLVCHVFKPERCHHCSTCNRCVLNMDHHCPWVSNCIGFYNRKFFMLFLFYTLLTLLIVSCAGVPTTFIIIRGWVDKGLANIGVKNIFIVTSCIMSTVLFFVLLNFFKYHVALVMTNTTTIEDLDKERRDGATSPPPNPFAPNPFDLGRTNNWNQVFGKRPLIWFIPIFTPSCYPIGDGVNWPQREVFEMESREVPNHNEKSFGGNELHLRPEEYRGLEESGATTPRVLDRPRS